jgi:hypothetical protein
MRLAVQRGGLWLAALALAMQLGVASSVPDLGAARALDALEARLAASICHDGSPLPAPSHHHGAACALCLFCQAFAGQGLLPLAAGPVLPARVAMRLLLTPPPATATPPLQEAHGFFARGPPAVR